MPREYPPAVLVHTDTCEDVINLRRRGEVLIPMATPDIARAYPNGRMHSCYHFTLQARGVVQTMTYPPHAYEPSSVIYRMPPESCASSAWARTAHWTRSLCPPERRADDGHGQVFTFIRDGL